MKLHDPDSNCNNDVIPFFSLLGLKRGMCSQINHFPEDADYDQDAAEYLLRELRAFVAPWCT